MTPAPGPTPAAAPMAGAVTTTGAAAGIDPWLPCPYRQAELLEQALSSGKMRVGFFLGAGCPLAVKTPDWPLIPDIARLTKLIRSTVGQDAVHKGTFDKILARLGDTLAKPKTVEQMLTQLRGLRDVVGEGEIDLMRASHLDALDKAICKAITEAMRKRLPTRDTPYHQLADWIRSIKRSHPVEIFTSNYDLLMEQALEDTEVPYFDGFAGSVRAFFDLASMEQEELPAHWARLWKVHGSVNWWRTPPPNKKVYRAEKGDVDDAQMIHPSHIKYDDSRKMPYLAMQDRLRAFLARGQSVLVTCGYSFLDFHLNQAILDGLGANPSAVCFGLLWGDREAAAVEVRKVKTPGNLRLLGADGGVLRRIDKPWHCDPKDTNEMHNLAVCTGALKDRSVAPDNQCKCLLGDFDAFGKFLADQLARRGQAEGDGNAT